MVWEGKDVIRTARQMMGETNPAASKPGSIRGDYCVETGRNILHGSDGAESAQHEIKMWFNENEINTWTPSTDGWLYEKK